MSFKDPIDAGGILVREELQSPNYITSVSGWRIARDGTAEFTGISITAGGVISLSGPLASTVIFSVRVVGEAHPRFQLQADGRVRWGDGTNPVDISLVRAGAAELLAEEQLTIRRGSAGSTSLGTDVSGDTVSRFTLGADGKMSWGSGSAAADITLERRAAGVLASGGEIWRESGSAFTGAYLAIVSGDTVPRLNILSNGTIEWGPGTGARDTNLYRDTNDRLKTDDALYVGGDFRHLGSGLGFYNANTIAKPTVTGSRGGNAALASLCTALANLGLITNSTT